MNESRALCTKIENDMIECSKCKNEHKIEKSRSQKQKLIEQFNRRYRDITSI